MSGNEWEDRFNFEEKASSLQVKLTLGILFDLSGIVAYNISVKEGTSESAYDEYVLLAALNEPLPPGEVEDFEGDLEEEIEVALSGEDIELLGWGALSHPRGKDIEGAIGLNAGEAVAIDGQRNRMLLAFLAAHEAFIAAGGSEKPELVETVRNQLS